MVCFKCVQYTVCGLHLNETIKNDSTNIRVLCFYWNTRSSTNIVTLPSLSKCPVKRASSSALRKTGKQWRLFARESPEALAGHKNYNFGPQRLCQFLPMRQRHWVKSQGGTSIKVNFTFFALPLTLVREWHSPGDPKNFHVSRSHTVTVIGMFGDVFKMGTSTLTCCSLRNSNYSHPGRNLFLFPSWDGRSCSQRLGQQIRFWPSGQQELGRSSETASPNSAGKCGTYAGNKTLNPRRSQTPRRLPQPSSTPPSNYAEIQTKSGPQTPDLSPKKLVSATPGLDWEWFSASLLFHLRYLKLEAPTSTIYRFRLAGPTVCKPIQTVKRTSKINDGLNNVFIITETRATEDKWFSRWGDSEKNVSHVPHEANNVHEESKALL